MALEYPYRLSGGFVESLVIRTNKMSTTRISRPENMRPAIVLTGRVPSDAAKPACNRSSPQQLARGLLAVLREALFGFLVRADAH